MADGMNRVTLFGNLGSDPELRVTQGGKSVMNMTVATTESYLDSNRVRKEKTEWHKVVVWGNQAEALSKFLQKGTKVLVEGSLTTDSWEKDGQKHYQTKVNAQRVLVAGGPGAQNRQSAPKSDTNGYDGDDDVPY